MSQESLKSLLRRTEGQLDVFSSFKKSNGVAFKKDHPEESKELDEAISALKNVRDGLKPLLAKLESGKEH